MKKKTSAEIKFNIELDVNNVPENIHWHATDGDKKKTEAKAVIISIWDGQNKTSLNIDLWTKEMRTDEMKHFFHQTLVSMADTLERATNEDKMAADMRDFCHHFAEKLLR